MMGGKSGSWILYNKRLHNFTGVNGRAELGAFSVQLKAPLSWGGYEFFRLQVCSLQPGCWTECTTSFLVGVTGLSWMS